MASKVEETSERISQSPRNWAGLARFTSRASSAPRAKAAVWSAGDPQARFLPPGTHGPRDGTHRLGGSHRRRPRLSVTRGRSGQARAGVEGGR